MSSAKSDFPEDVRTMKRRLVRLAKRPVARIRRAVIKEIHAKAAIGRSAFAARTYTPIAKQAAAKRQRLVHSTRRDTSPRPVFA